MRVLIFWDIFWRIGREAFKKNFQAQYDLYKPDFVIVNPENITSGRWPLSKHIEELDRLWNIDVYTSGNHIFDNFDDIKEYLNLPNSKLLRPANYYETDLFDVPGKWYKVLEKNGKKLLVINLLWTSFMRDDVYNPYIKIHEILKLFEWENFDGIIIDFHRETTSELAGMALFLDGKASFVYGTHTHVQTNDETILPQWTGFLTDVGCSWPRFSLIGTEYESFKKKLFWWVGSMKNTQSLNKDYIVNGCVVDIDEKSKKCIQIEKIKIIWKL